MAVVRRLQDNCQSFRCTNVRSHMHTSVGRIQWDSFLKVDSHNDHLRNDTEVVEEHCMEWDNFLILRWYIFHFDIRISFFVVWKDKIKLFFLSIASTLHSLPAYYWTITSLFVNKFECLHVTNTLWTILTFLGWEIMISWSRFTTFLFTNTIFIPDSWKITACIIQKTKAFQSSCGFSFSFCVNRTRFWYEELFL